MFEDVGPSEETWDEILCWIEERWTEIVGGIETKIHEAQEQGGTASEIEKELGAQDLGADRDHCGYSR
jgi:hypothetical protein